MNRYTSLVLVALGCASPEIPPPATAQSPATAPALASPPSGAAGTTDAGVAMATAVQAAAPMPGTADEVWLKGTTHVHAKPSGDSTEPIENVVAWYEKRGYDFIVLSDHNRVSEVGLDSTRGQRAVRAPEKGLLVIAGVELTHNPSGCLPEGDASKKCRIHVNALGVTERPEGKIEWADRQSNQRVDMYQAGINEARRLGASLVQINHPNYYWGMTPGVLTEIAKRGAQLVEIANVQFEKNWNGGDKDHPSTEALWDAVLATGATLWGIATDDAHDYQESGGGKYPAGGGWVVVKAKRDPRAILDALAAGRFYSSTGVVLARAEVDGEMLVVEVSPTGASRHTITFIENGNVVGTSSELTTKRLLPRTGYVRAVITRDDGKKAWVQPARR